MTNLSRFRPWLVVVLLALFAFLVWDVTSRLLDAENILTPRARSGMPHTRPASVAQPLPGALLQSLTLFAGGPLRARAERVQQTPAAFPGGLKAHGGLNTNLWTPYL